MLWHISCSVLAFSLCRVQSQHFEDERPNTNYTAKVYSQIAIFYFNNCDSFNEALFITCALVMDTFFLLLLLLVSAAPYLTRGRNCVLYISSSYSNLPHFPLTYFLDIDMALGFSSQVNKITWL